MANLIDCLDIITQVMMRHQPIQKEAQREGNNILN